MRGARVPYNGKKLPLTDYSFVSGYSAEREGEVLPGGSPIKLIVSIEVEFIIFGIQHPEKSFAENTGDVPVVGDWNGDGKSKVEASLKYVRTATAVTILK